MSQVLQLILLRNKPALTLTLTQTPPATAEMAAAVTGGPGPKGDPGDVNLVELTVDPTLIFENALV